MSGNPTELASNFANQPIPPPFVRELEALIKIFETLNKNYTAGQQTVTIEVLTVGTTAGPLYVAPKLVRGGTLMNLSTTDNITIGGGGEGQKGKAFALVAGQGIILNSAAAVGQGGGTFNFGNIDLSTLNAVTNLNATQKLAVVYYN